MLMYGVKRILLKKSMKIRIQMQYPNILCNKNNIYLIYIYMPIQVRKVRGKECYQVKNVQTGVVHAKCATKKKAQAQKRLLDAIDHGFKPKK